MTLDKKLNDAFEAMMKYRQSIGYATATYRSSVPLFINFCVKKYPLSARITQEMVDEWLAYYPYTAGMVDRAGHTGCLHTAVPCFPEGGKRKL